MGLVYITCKWLEWGHVPTWCLVSWILSGGFNSYNWFTLKEFAEISGNSWAPYGAANNTSSFAKSQTKLSPKGVELNGIFENFDKIPVNDYLYMKFD